MDYNIFLEQNHLRLCKDNIIRDQKNHPKCPNEIFEDLLIKKQNGQLKDMFEDKLYGACLLSLIEIVINGPKFRYQTQDIKDECRRRNAIRDRGYRKIL